MAAAVPSASASANAETPISRPVQLIRVAVLLVAGIAIAFSATLHEQLGFDLGVTSIVLGLIGIAHLIEWISRRASGGSVVPLVLAIASVAAAIVLPFVGSVIGFAFVVAAWALVSALLEFVGSTVRPGSRSDAVFLGAIGLLLALFVILVREDQVAILGFLGAYAMLAGVFLGISAFDIRRDTEARGPVEQ